jgi:diguanylate cyclase (GGDEF)-like protein
VAAESDEYYPVYFSTEQKTSRIYGLDYWTDPERRAALEHARDEDEIKALRTKLFEGRNGPNAVGIAVSVPVYAKGTSRTTVADRRRNLAGIFDLTQLLQSIRNADAANPAVSISVYPPAAAGAGHLAQRDAPDFSSVQRIRASGDLQWWTTLRIGDANWRLLATPAIDGQLIAQHYRALVLLAAGLIVTLFLAVYLALASRNSLQLSLANRRVLELAQTDILTELPNRAYLLEQLQKISVSQQAPSTGFSILMLDLDRFKNVNDSLGHAAGDALLRQVARRLRSTLRDSDVLARFGGDEFAIVQSECDSQRAASIALAARICKVIAEPFQLPGNRVEIGTSVGIALAPEHGDDLEQLLKKADLALYRSKTMGRNSYTVYDDAMSAELEARNTLESDLRDAIARCQFELHYQPFFDVVSGERRGLEALVRWRHPVKGLIPPDQFIPLAEETGLIVPLGEWVMRQVCDDATWFPPDLEVAVNLSPVQFKHEELFDHPVRAAGFRPRARAARTRNHRIRAAGTRRREPRLRRKAEKHRHFARPRRFRHRLFLAQLSHDVSVRQDQDRQIIHSRTYQLPQT